MRSNCVGASSSRQEASRAARTDAYASLAGGVGVKLASDVDLPPHAWFFAEDQGRYLIAVSRDEVDAALAEAAAAGVAASYIGKVEGDHVVLGDRSVPLAEARAAHELGFSRMME